MYHYTEFFPSLKQYIYNDIITHIPCHILRISYLRYIMQIPIGRDTFIHMHSRFSGNITIGHNTVIGRSCAILGEITIGNNVNLSSEIHIISNSHDKNDNTFKAFNLPVNIQKHAWVCTRSMIMPGINIGCGSILGAMSIATKDIPDHEIHAGCPAKKISTRSKVNYTLKYNPFFQ